MLRFVAALLVLTTCRSAHSGILSGVVMDGSNGVPLNGATVTLQNTGLVATTDAQGHYRFDDDAIAGLSPVPQSGSGGNSAKKDTTTLVITFSRDGYTPVSRFVNATHDTENAVLTLDGKVTYVCTTADAKGRWQIARTVFDPATKTSEITWLTDTELWNFKPNFSPDGSRLTFFRRYAVNGPCCETWRSSICVMNADGTGLHEIIDGEPSFNTEPYWSRNGSNLISFNRMNVPDAGPCWNDANGQPGAEQRLAPWGWINSHLADGRVFIQRGGKSFLAAPSGNGKASYTPVQRADDKFIHKIALSQDETMIAYQKWVDPEHNMYKGGVMVYAKFDASVPAITDEVIFDELNPATMAWYVSISTDNRYLLFAKDGAILQFDTKTQITQKVSADSDPYKAYPTYTTFSK